MTIESNNFFDEIILKCTQQILDVEQNIFTIKFFIDIKIFDTSLLGPAIEDAKIAIIKWVINACLKTKSLNSFIESSQSFSSETFHTYLLKEVLVRELFIEAILLLNQNAKPELPEIFKKIISDHCEKYRSTNCFNVSFYDALRNLTDLKFKDNLFSYLARHQSQQINPGLLNVELAAVIPDKKLRTDSLIDVLCNALCSNQTNVAREAQALLPSSEKEIWLKVINYEVEGNHLELISLLVNGTIYNAALLKKICTSPLWSQGCGTLELYKLVQKFQDSYMRLLASTSNQNNTNNSILVLETILNETFNQWQTRLIQGQKQLILAGDLVKLLQKKLPNPTKTTALSLLKSLIEILMSENRIALSADCAITLLKEYNSLVIPISTLDKIAEGLLAIHFKDEKSHCFTKLLELLGLIKPFDQSVVIKCLLNICEYCVKGNVVEPIPQILNPNTFTITQQIELKVKEWIFFIIDNNFKFQSMNLLVKTYLTSTTETTFEEIIKKLIAKGLVISAQEYLATYIKLPGTKLRLQQALEPLYVQQLGSLIGTEVAEKLKSFSQQVAPLLRALKNPKTQTEANFTKNHLIVELRSTLDKAFLALYKQHYGEPPLLPDHSGNHVNVYFPIVPAFKLAKHGNLDACLKYHFQKMGIKNFATEHSKIYAYIKSIQPTANGQYAWLTQLYQMANEQKHASDLKSTHKVDEIEINFTTFLPKLFDGITDILLHLFQKPHVSNDQISKLKFSDYVKMDESTMPSQTMHGFLTASNVQAQTSNNNNAHTSQLGHH